MLHQYPFMKQHFFKKIKIFSAITQSTPLHGLKRVKRFWAHQFSDRGQVSNGEGTTTLMPESWGPELWGTYGRGPEPLGPETWRPNGQGSNGQGPAPATLMPETWGPNGQWGPET